MYKLSERPIDSDGNYESNHLKLSKNLRKIKRQKMSMRFWKNCLIIILFLAVVHFWLQMKSYRFSEENIIKIGQKYSGKEIEQALQKVASELQERYPGHILPPEYRKWVMFKNSGMTLLITVLHASMTEYVALTGSAVETQGYLGRHWLNVTRVVLSGSIKYWKEGYMEAIENNPGDNFTLYSGTTGSLAWGENAWILEYGRGFVPMSLPTVLADQFFSCFDVLGILKLIRAFGVAYYYELKSDIASFIGSI